MDNITTRYLTWRFSRRDTRAADLGRYVCEKMRIISAEEWELLSFFETEPRIESEKVPWPYNDFLYEIEREDLFLSFSVHPAYRDVRIILKYKGRIIYELNSMGVADIRLSNKEGVEVLKIILTSKESLFIKVKPFIEIKHQAELEI